MKIVILIPTYNEKENVLKLLKELNSQARRLRKHTFKILIVDDNSPDGTGELVRQYMAKHKNVYLLSHRKEGLGRAMIRGYKYVLKNLKPDVVVTNEADFGFDFKLLPKMLTKISEGYDVVVASRHVGTGRTDGWTTNRKINHWIANSLFAKYIAGVNEVHDKNGALRAIRVKGTLDKLNFNTFPLRGFAFFFYQIYWLSRVTSKFYEIPATFTFRRKGESKISFNPKYFSVYLRDVAEYVSLAFKIRLEKLRLI